MACITKDSKTGWITVKPKTFSIKQSQMSVALAWIMTLSLIPPGVLSGRAKIIGYLVIALLFVIWCAVNCFTRLIIKDKSIVIKTAIKTMERKFSEIEFIDIYKECLLCRLFMTEKLVIGFNDGSHFDLLEIDDVVHVFIELKRKMEENGCW